MANSILATSRLSRNEISSLARVFEISFDHFCRPGHYFPNANDYLREIKTIVGLGFAAVLVENDYLLTTYQSQLAIFLQCFDFRSNKKRWSQLSQSLAEMIGLSLGLSAYNYQNYFQGFSICLRRILSSVSIQMHLDKETDRIVNKVLGMLRG